MKKVFYFQFLLIAIFALFSINTAEASHCVGGDITYTYQGPNQYLITFRFYRDCAGIPAPTQAQLCYSSANCGLNGTITLLPIPGTGLEIPPSPCLPTTVSTCQGGQGYGVQEWIFQGTVNLPAMCTDWTFSWEECCRNNLITTINNAAGTGMYLSAKLDNLTNAVNSSPFFNNIPVTQFCVNNQFYYNQQATDPDGDSLVYTLVAAQDAPFGCPQVPFNLTYNAPYSATNPIASLNGVTLDPSTGLVSFVPTLQQVGVICVRVDEYRNGVLIGSVKRDIQMNVTAACIPNTPSFDSTLYNGTTGLFTITAGCGDTSIILSFQHDIQCGSIVATDVRVSDPNGLPNPVLSATAINCQNGMTDSILVNLFYPLTAGTSYLFTKIGNDANTFLSECGTQMPEFDSIAVIVLDTGVYVIPSQNVSCFFTQLTINFPEEFTCGTIVANASDFQFVDVTGTSFPIVSVTSNCSPSSQYDFTNQLTFNFASGVTGTGPYYLIVQSGSDLNTVANKCGTFFQVGDTLAQLNVTNNIIVSLGPDITVCASDPLPVLDAGNPGVTFTWYLNGVLISDTTQTILANSSGTYTVVCFYSGTCQGTDTVNVTINPAPAPEIGPPVSICAGDPVPTFTVTGISGNATYQWYFNGFALAGDTLSTLTPDTSMGSGTYSVIVNTGGSCDGTDDLLFTINPGLVPNVGGDLIICQNDPVTLTAGVTANSYQWFDQFGNIPGAIGSSYQVPTGQPGTYTYGVIATGPCQGTDTMQLIINPIPSGITAGPDTSVCITDNYTLSVATGSASYQWYNNGVVIAGATGSTYMPTSTGTYSVLVSNGTCTATDTVNVTVFLQAPVPTVTNNSYCSGTTVPTLDAGVTGVTYLWSNGATTQVITPSGPGTYTITVSAGSCTASASATIAQIATPQPALSNANRCADETTSLVLDPGVNDPSYSYQWFDNTGTAITGATNSTYTVPQPYTNTSFSITIINPQNGLNCTGSASMTVTLNPSVTVDTISAVTICSGFSATFVANSPSSSPTYSWTGPNGFTANTASMTIGGATVAATGTYTVTVTDANGCTGTQTADLLVEPCDITPHNVMTPNGDLNNDYFHITNITSYPSNTVRIFNRWGNKVYDESGYNNTSVKFEGTDLPDGTYYFIITAPEITKLVSGTITLIRVETK